MTNGRDFAEYRGPVISMGTEISDFLRICFSGANLPASILLVVMLFYWLLAILAGLDLNVFEFDLDLDAEPDLGATLSLGFVVLRFLNIGRVPLMLWMAVFAICYWTASVLLDRLLDDPEYRETLFYAVQYGVRNLAVSVVATKLFTHPLRDKFDVKEPNRVQDLLGRECVITTSEVSELFGQAEVAAEGAPLRLNVRSHETSLTKGDVAVIVGYDKDRSVYYVGKPETEG